MITEKTFDAIEFATRVHRGQFRKSTMVPKIVHLIGTMNILIEMKCQEEVVIAGILHDVLEDTTVRFDDIQAKFGKKVAVLVLGASEKDKSQTWEKRKNDMINYLKKAPKLILWVVLADRLDNLRFTKREHESVEEKVWERFNRGKAKQIRYYKSVSKIFSERLRDEASKPFVDELQQLTKFFEVVRETRS